MSTRLLRLMYDMPHAIVVRLHVHKGDVVSWCLSRNPSVSEGFSIQDEAMDVARMGSLPYRHFLLAPLTGNKEGSMGFMVPVS